MSFEQAYNKYYKVLLAIPIILIIIALSLIISKYVETGEFINKDVSLKGGVSATVYTDKIVDLNQLKSAIPGDSLTRKLTDFSTGKQLGILIEASDVKSDDLKKILEKELSLTLTEENYSIEETGSSLGKSFYKELITAIIFAFIFMAVVVFITFKNFIPSIAVIQAGFTDIVVTLAIVNLIGMKISSAGIVAFLMVLGYSIDTDILLTTRILKRQERGVFYERMISSIKTGLTMTGTTFVALLAGYIISFSEIIREMFLIILISIVIDIIATYCGNAAILKWYCDKKGIK